MCESVPSHDELVTIYKNVLDGICVIDAEANILRANPAFARMSGYALAELIGRPIQRFIELDPVDDLRRFTDSARSQPVPPRERVGRRKNGTRYVAEVHGAHSTFGDQPVVVAIVRDITERKQHAEQYRQSRERLALVVQQSPMAIITWDLEFRVNQWNLAAEEIFGHSRAEALGRHAEFIVPAAARKHVDRVWQSLLTLKGGRRSTNENVTRSGRTILCEWYNAPLVDAEGRVIGVLSLVEDVSEQRQLEVERERLLAAIQQTDDAVLITDSQALVQYVNPAFERVTGYTFDEVRGQNPRFLKSGVHEAEFYAGMWRTITSGQTWRADIVNRCKSGALITENVSISPIVDDSGRIVSYVSVRRDVTRLRAMEEQLVQAQKMEAIGRLAGGVAHDFNNMLSVILGYTELILPRLAADAGFVEELREIDRAARRSAEMTRQLLAFSRHQIIEPRVVDLNATIAAMTGTLARLIGEDIELTFEPAADLWRIKIDPSQVDQIVANLAANARDAMPEGGRLRIETANVTIDESIGRKDLAAPSGQYVRLLVSDTGSGMDEETRAHIFEPFYTTKPIDEGTGLGLAMVQGIVSQNDGFVLVESEVARGATFTILLPRCEESTSEPASPPPVSEKRGARTILLVEDDTMVRNLTRAMLERMGHEVLQARSAAAAVRVFHGRRGAIDLLITDVVMPGTSGRDLVATLAAEQPQLKTLFMSGYSADIISHRGVLEQGVHFIQKPFGFEELSRKVQEAIDNAS